MKFHSLGSFNSTSGLVLQKDGTKANNPTGNSTDQLNLKLELDCLGIFLLFVRIFWLFGLWFLFFPPGKHCNIFTHFLF